jgi:hypothetical protein
MENIWIGIVTNSYALRGAIEFHRSGFNFSALIVGFAMLGSMIYHVFENENSPLSKPLDGILWNDRRWFGSAKDLQLFLTIDRITAISLTCNILLYHLWYRGNLEMFIKHWKLIVVSIVSLGVSDLLLTSKWPYLILHSVWHFGAFHFVFKVAQNYSLSKHNTRGVK